MYEYRINQHQDSGHAVQDNIWSATYGTQREEQCKNCGQAVTFDVKKKNTLWDDREITTFQSLAGTWFETIARNKFTK
ncbi:hypothetical protein BpHYR1_008971 [Brachionus plicatilis]|uniref:Uncharacterized protein n=1 Tax=Brachionus plicatilis TaxID=10195 RepID=A0A3M7RWN9_BRAPC|nr:hypothetical protein BpHYR1_008971 [Brachionus plicatilis]